MHYKAKDNITYLFVSDSKIIIDSNETNKTVLRVDLINNKTGNKEIVSLIPVGETILRQVTFSPNTK